MSITPNLHDAKLVNFFFEWKSKTLECLLEPVSVDGSLKKLVFIGVWNISIPAENPWGESIYINKFSEINIENGLLFSFQMQSGDIFEIRASKLKFID